MCGENQPSSPSSFGRAGSPPRVRGKLALGGERPFRSGITPACAGKTLFWQGCFPELEDHPRVCGENNPPRSNISSSLGSPPRVRGKQYETVAEVEVVGITPACAGKTSPPRPRPSGARDHPRVCGENSLSEASGLFDQGSPPRVRGKPCFGRVASLNWRITPACAGKTIRLGQISLHLWDHPRVCGENSTRQ